MTFEEIKEKGVITKKQLSYLYWKKRGKVNSDGCLVCEETKWYFKDYFICEYDSYNAIEMLKEEFNIKVDQINEETKQKLLFIAAFLPFKFSEVYGEYYEAIDHNAYSDKCSHKEYITPSYDIDYINKIYPNLDYSLLVEYIKNNYTNKEYISKLQKHIKYLKDTINGYYDFDEFIITCYIGKVMYQLENYVYDLEILVGYLKESIWI